jgi:Abnormal spindle-like microcephaly-assoc'd, ASPM-SPD-2-Hydin
LNAWLSRALCISVLVGLSGSEVTLRADPQAATATITIAPKKLDFGSRAVNAAGPAQTVTITNAGNSELTIHDVLTSGFDFSQTNTCGPTLAVGASCAIQVMFKPATSGPRLGTLNIFDSAAGSPHMIAIEGVGK